MKKQDENAPFPGQVTIEELANSPMTETQWRAYIAGECQSCRYYESEQCVGHRDGSDGEYCIVRRW